MWLAFHLYILVGVFFYFDPKIKKNNDPFYLALLGFVFLILVWPIRLVMLIVERR